MEVAEEIKNLAQSIINSYESRVKTISVLMKKAGEVLKSFRLEQGEMINELRERLAKNESLRKKDFDSMWESVQVKQKEREKEVTQRLERFQKEQGEMVAELRRVLMSVDYPRLEDFEITKENILTRQRERERELGETLKNFHQEQEEISSALRKLLSKNESLRINNFRAMIKAFQVQQREKESEVNRMLIEFERVDEEINKQWQRVMGDV